jgi:ABC-type nitrate/sulfonate/bicarbonate transport system permease component
VSRYLPFLRRGGKPTARQKNRTDLFKKGLITIASLVAFVCVWWALSILLDSDYLPPPDVVANAFIDTFAQVDPLTGLNMWDNIWASLKRVVAGFALAFVTAVPLGLVMGFSKRADEFSKPIVEIFRPIPPIAWAPILVIAMGVILGPIVVVFVGVFFPLLSNVIFGVKSIDPLLTDAARTLGAKRTDLFSKVILPSTVPYMMTGIRIGLGIGWMCIVAAEFIAAVGGGVGQYIIFKTQVGRYDQVFAALIVIAILGLMTTEFSGYIEKKVSKWMGLK